MRGILFTLSLAALVTFAAIPRAEACGGQFCFNPAPGETPIVVTDHRMIFTIAKDQSTLYDQIRYTGAPASFAWVLPYFGDGDAGTVAVGVSADVLFSALDRTTQTTVRPPPISCAPVQPCPGSSSASSSGTSGSSSGGPTNVTVIRREVVGPYDTVHLKATTPGALQTWLSGNGYTIPSDVAAVIAKYQQEGANFLAVKLVPGKDVQDMRPIRVTTKGANVALPLRMVAAGTGATVGVTLWVVAEGRYEPQNFASFVIKVDELVWDFAQSRSNYTEVRAAKMSAGGGKIWEIENSAPVDRGSIESSVKTPNYNGGPPYPTTDEAWAAVDYLAAPTAIAAREDDLDTLFHGIAGNVARVTRMRSDLARAALGADLYLRAEATQSEVPTVRQLTRSVNAPACPSQPICPTSSGSPTGSSTGGFGTSGAASGEKSASTFTCAASAAAGDAWLLAVATAGAALVAARARRSRTKTKKR